jgi:hypothetical protein
VTGAEGGHKALHHESGIGFARFDPSHGRHERDGLRFVEIVQPTKLVVSRRLGCGFKCPNRPRNGRGQILREASRRAGRSREDKGGVFKLRQADIGQPRDRSVNAL